MNSRIVAGLMLTAFTVSLLAACGGSGNSENAVKACEYTRSAIGSQDDLALVTLTHSGGAVEYAFRAADENPSKYSALRSASLGVQSHLDDYGADGSTVENWDVALQMSLWKLDDVCRSLGETG